MEINFTKMEGTGNDYIYIDCFQTDISDKPWLKDMIIKISDRHFGVGGDGVILIAPSKNADAKMIMYNADGSRGKMCGNGIRCVGKYVYDHQISLSNPLKIETDSGLKILNLTINNAKVDYVTVDMGKYLINNKDIPVSLNKETTINEKVSINNNYYNITCVSMGNPHCVVFVDNVDLLDLEKIGPTFEHNDLFPEGINTEFVELINDSTIKMRVWERGSGETLSCGTGACASVVACILNNKMPYNKEIKVQIKGGELFITCDQNNNVTMKGPARIVFEGTYHYEN